jgi:prevent-host-death family protein
MSASISVADAKAGFAALVARAEAGEDIIVTRNGRPVARLIPLHSRPVAYGDLAGLKMSDDLSLPEDIIGDFVPGDAP